MTAPLAILIDVISFIVSTACISFIKSKEAAPQPSNQHIVSAIREGMSVIWQDPIFRPITCATAVLNFCGSAFGAIYILYVTDALHISSFSLGIVLGIGSAGALLGSFVANRLIQKSGVGWTLIISCFMIVIGSFIVPMIPVNAAKYVIIRLLALGQLLSTIGSTVYFITQVSLRQTITPNHLLGRVNASNRFISRSFMPLGALAGGALGSIWNPKLSLLLFGIAFATSAIVLWFSSVAKLKDMADAGAAYAKAK
jgi:MFS family permease